ncbi:hypothetical protein GOODEAATRI_013300 [Goodea atripinnis]|uniref:Uncharacterized protein n=1 Tax=Goodea atripinnis TaxID=208336 RepID=A0ABV0MT50_9TELE
MLPARLHSGVLHYTSLNTTTRPFLPGWRALSPTLKTTIESKSDVTCQTLGPRKVSYPHKFVCALPPLIEGCDWQVCPRIWSMLRPIRRRIKKSGSPKADARLFLFTEW